ncbi:hypothetical protein RLIN73S_06016 [Rhodanobacter lindaniclasticus]
MKPPRPPAWSRSPRPRRCRRPFTTASKPGSAAGDPQHARTISLAHGGQVIALQAAAGQAVPRGAPLLTITPDPAIGAVHTSRHAARWRSPVANAAAPEQLAAQRLATQSQLAAARKALADAQGDAGRAARAGRRRRQPDRRGAGRWGGHRAAGRPGRNGSPRMPPCSISLRRMPCWRCSRCSAEDGARLRPGMPRVQLRAVYGTQAFAGTRTGSGGAINPQSRLLDAQVSNCRPTRAPAWWRVRRCRRKTAPPTSPHGRCRAPPCCMTSTVTTCSRWSRAMPNVST